MLVVIIIIIYYLDLEIIIMSALYNNNDHVADFAVGSMPADYGYDDEGYNHKEDDTQHQIKPRILILGLRRLVDERERERELIFLLFSKRSGKSSIKNVVFHKMQPNETLFIETTTKTNVEDVSCCSFITFQVYDCAGQVDIFNDPTLDHQTLLKGCGSLIFVIDAQVYSNMFKMFSI